MKAKLIFAVLLPAVLLSSCIVKSLHPFYTEEAVVFRQELIGSWTDQDAGKWEIRQSKKKKNAYEITLNKDEASAVFIAHLFRLNNTLYLDFFPESDNAATVDLFNLHLIPSHSLARIRLSGNSLIGIEWLNEEWLSELFAQNRVRIRHEVVQDYADKEEKMYILTASTEELQKFILKYGHEPEAFRGKSEVVMNLKRVP